MFRDCDDLAMSWQGGLCLIAVKNSIRQSGTHNLYLKAKHQASHWSILESGLTELIQRQFKHTSLGHKREDVHVSLWTRVLVPLRL